MYLLEVAVPAPTIAIAIAIAISGVVATAYY